MSYDKTINQIAIVGTGTIGASWTTHYLSRGFDVVATDPGPDAEAKVRKYVDDKWDLLQANGLVAAGASRDRLSFTANQGDALAKADFVQENAPERPGTDFKPKLYIDLDAATPEDTVIASSSSGIPPTTIQSMCKHPERVLIGHPFNPPHTSRPWRSMRRSERSRSFCTRSSAGMSRTGSRRLSTERSRT
jgi:3-hydroxyacyl-CoA dehydrogenase